MAGDWLGTHVYRLSRGWFLGGQRVTRWQLGEEEALRVLRGVLKEPGQAGFSRFSVSQAGGQIKDDKILLRHLPSCFLQSQKMPLDFTGLLSLLFVGLGGNPQRI